MRIVLTGNSCFKIANFREGLVRELLRLGYEVVVLAPVDAHRQKLLDMGCVVRDLPMDRNGTALFTELRLLIRIHRFLRNYRLDFVFGYTIKNNIYAGLACRALNIPFIPNVTGLGPAFNGSGPLNKVVRALYRQAFARVRAVFFQNPDDLAEFLRAKLVRAEQVFLLPGSGVNLQSFPVRPLPSRDHGMVFLLVARMLWDKGVGQYVDASRQLQSLYPHARFELLGPIDSASRSGIPESQVDAWHDEGVITYLGETNDIRHALAGAHCIVLPSYYREGTPRILLEAAATGRPAITTDTPGCRDAVDDNVTGFLCLPRDVGSLVAAMQRVLDMENADWTLMSRAARARAETAFDEAIVIKAYVDQLDAMGSQRP